jgi:hypothetical protein
MHNNQDPSVAIPTDGYPSFFCLAVLLVKHGHGQRIQKEFGGSLEVDSMLVEILLRFDGVPLKIVAQRLPTVSVYHGRHSQGLTGWAFTGAPLFGASRDQGHISRLLLLHRWQESQRRTSRTILLCVALHDRTERRRVEALVRPPIVS